MDTPIADMAQMSPFALIKEQGLTPVQVQEIQNSLQAEGQSLWDWHSFAYLYKDALTPARKKETCSTSSKAPGRKAHPTHIEGFKRLSYDITGSCNNVSTIALYVSQLSDLQREAVELLYGSRRSAKDVAKLLDVREGTVYGRKQMAVRRLRALWQKGNGSPPKSRRR